MRILDAIPILAALVNADVCSDFCIRKLGRETCELQGLGTYCKDNGFCHNLQWTTPEKEDICVFGGPTPCIDVNHVLCTEAILPIPTEPVVEASPAPVQSDRVASFRARGQHRLGRFGNPNGPIFCLPIGAVPATSCCSPSTSAHGCTVSHEAHDHEDHENHDHHQNNHVGYGHSTEESTAAPTTSREHHHECDHKHNSDHVYH